MLISPFEFKHSLTEREVVRSGSILDIIPMLEDDHFIRKKQPLHLVVSDPNDAFEILKTKLKIIRSAGGIVWNRKQEMLMIYRRGIWDLPKGKIEEGESTETAALREVQEEAGVGMLRLVQPFSSTYHIYKEFNEWVLKDTTWYEMICLDEGAPVPQTFEGITEVKWVPNNEILKLATASYASVLHLVTEVMEKGYNSGH